MVEQYRSDRLIVRSVDAKSRTVTAMASTPEVDRYGSIILPSAFAAYMDRYMANPVLLDNHRQNGDPVGRCIDYRITESGLEMTFEFAPTTAGDEKLALYSGGFMRGFSVAGQMRDVVFAWDEEERKAALTAFARTALSNGQADFVITSLELLEVSCATIPANPGAMARAVAEGSIDPEVARGLFLARAMPDPAAEEPDEEEESPSVEIEIEVEPSEDDAEEEPSEEDPEEEERSGVHAASIAYAYSAAIAAAVAAVFASEKFAVR